MEKERQIYIDPFYAFHNVMKARLIWDTHTYMTVRFEFDKLVKGDRFKIISFLRELLIRSGYEMTMTKQEFINIQFKEFDGLKIKLKIMDF